MNPTVTVGRRINGVAGQFAYNATVTYLDSEPETVTFLGTVYGSSVTLLNSDNVYGLWVTEPSRFGEELSPAWIRAYYGPQEATR